MNKIYKIFAFLSAVALLGASSAILPVGFMVPLISSETASAETTFKATVETEGNGSFVILNGTNGGDFSLVSGIDVVATANDGYFVDKLYYRTSDDASWLDMDLYGFPWKASEYPKRTPFSFTPGSSKDVNLKVVFSQLPQDQSYTDGSGGGTSPATNIGMLTINYHSELGSASSNSPYQIPFNLDTQQQQLLYSQETKIASLEDIREDLEKRNLDTASVTPNEHSIFKGWAMSEDGFPEYQPQDAIDYSIYQLATPIDEYNRTLNLYAVWFDDSGAAGFEADCYIDKNRFSNFDPATHEYTFPASSDTSSHSVEFIYPSSWTPVSPRDKGHIEQEDGNVTHHTAYIKWVFYKGDDQVEYLFKWVWDTSNSSSTTKTLEEVLETANMTVRNSDKTEEASISPDFSYDTTDYTATGADLSHGIFVSFSTLPPDDIDDLVVGEATTKTSTIDGVETTTYTYPVTVSRNGESKTFNIKYVASEQAVQAPSYDELNGLVVKINGTNYTNFVPTTTSYNLAASTDSYDIVLTNVPSGWHSTQNGTSGSSTKPSSISFTLSKGTLSRTYTFSWTTITSNAPSYNDLSQMVVQIDGQTYNSFRSDKTTYDMGETASGHTVRFSNVPSGWTDTTRRNTTSDKMTITHMLVNGSLSRAYTFQWNIKSSAQADPWASLKFSMNNSNYTAFNPSVNSYNVPGPITRSGWSGLPAGTTATKKTTSVKNGTTTTHTLRWTLVYGGETRHYAFSWNTTNSDSGNGSDSSSSSSSSGSGSSGSSGSNSGSSGSNSGSSGVSSGSDGSGSSGISSGSDGSGGGSSEEGVFNEENMSTDNGTSSSDPESNSPAEISQPSENANQTSGNVSLSQPTQNMMTTTTSSSDTARERINIPTNVKSATSNEAQPLSSTGETKAAILALLAIISSIGVAGFKFILKRRHS